jgi:hypothetical protein
MYKNLGRERPRFKTDPTAWRSFLYYPARLVGLERVKVPPAEPGAY